MEQLKAILGLKMCDGIGSVTANKLISHCGCVQAIYEEKRQHMSNIPGLPSKIYDVLHNNINWTEVDREIDLIEKHHLNYVTVVDKEYPQNLLLTGSPPLILFFKGQLDALNSRPCISIVGTRLATGYGLDAVKDLISGLKNTGVCIVSGLAQGIDIAAHKEAMNQSLPTIGVVGHGLKTMYPSSHVTFANQMMNAGGAVLTEFFYHEIPNRENFPKRNRIIAGLSSSTIVIEAAKRGGALITAEIALELKRKVFALPGRYNDKLSEGCNALIKTRRVKPIQSIQSIIEELGLKKQKPLIAQKQELNPSERVLMEILNQRLKISLDNISALSQTSISECAATLFNLELKGIIRSLPGKSYELC